VDRRVGLIPLSAGDQGGTILLVRSSSLLDALYELFELIWERSTPIAFTRAGKLKTEKAGAALSDAAEQVILLLAAGLNDKAIAHEAGISAMTLSRRITELMKAFDTRTRFQLGWRAALDAFPERVTAKTRGKRKLSTR
jgi:DNA-binding NarL/FixJ family response regulator